MYNISGVAVSSRVTLRLWGAVAWTTLAALLVTSLAACRTTDPSALTVSTDLKPMTHGWSFSNFPSTVFPNIVFNDDDLVAMFGADPSVCVDGLTTPCELTAEAAAWAQMINQARSSGHCQGLAVLAAQRFDDGLQPLTAQVEPTDSVIRAVMRAFATQFLPELQLESTSSLSKSLREKVEILS